LVNFFTVGAMHAFYNHKWFMQPGIWMYWFKSYSSHTQWRQILLEGKGTVGFTRHIHNKVWGSHMLSGDQDSKFQ
jgi:hypothetical protein